MNISVEVLREAATLKNGHYHKFLKELKLNQMERLAVAKDEGHFRTLQGDICRTSDLIEMIDGARDRMEQMAKPRPNTKKAF